MPSCSVKWCSNHTSTCSLKLKNGVSFHRFPKDEATCQKWVEAVRHERRDPWWTSSNASRICSIHFKETDISSTPCKVNILTKTAVPICTMVWYDENNTTSKTSNETTNTYKPILKTYERKKTNINMPYNWNKESIAMSKTNSVVISNMTPYPSKDNLPQATKLLDSLEVPKKLNLKERQESNSIANISSKTSANVNVTEVQKNTILTESNKKEYSKSYKEKCCELKILVKPNDNTGLILDEDSNDDTKPKECNKVSKKSNSRTCENSKKVTFKKLKSDENKQPKQVTNISNADMFLETITKDNVVLNANISKSYVGKMLRIYLPKRRNKIIEKHIKETSKIFKIKKNKCPFTIEKGINIVKCKVVNNTNVNKYPKDYLSDQLNTGICNKSNIISDLQSNRYPQQKNQRALLNVKKYTFKRGSNLLNNPRIRNQNKAIVDEELNIDGNKESCIAHIDEFITNQSRINRIKETDIAVYDELIAELFETSKNVITNGNISNIPSNDYQETNDNMCIESNTFLGTDNNMQSILYKEKYNRHDIIDLDTNIYTELNTPMDSKLRRVVNTGLNSENTGVNIDKTTINENIKQFNNNAMSESDQQLSIINKNMYYNENITNNAILSPNNELQNLKTSVISQNVPETKKGKFTNLKKYLSTKSNPDLAELCKNTLTDTILCDRTMSMALTKENIQVPEQSHNAEFDQNTSIDVNDMVTSIQNNINTEVTKKTESILLEELITNTSPESNNSENLNFIKNLETDRKTIRSTINKRKNSDINDCKKSLERDMPELNTVSLSDLNEDQLLKSNGVMNRKFHHLNSEMCTDRDLILQKSKKDFVNVLAASDDQQTVVNEHMDVVDSILNRDIDSEFDLSLLLSDTPIPDEEIQNLDNNFNNNSLDGIVGSPNWIQLATGEMPKIIDDILDQGSPFFENLDLFDKANKFNMDIEGNKKDNKIQKLIKEKYSISNFEQCGEQNFNYCENGKQCTKNSIAQIEKQLIAEISDHNETSLKQNNHIWNENEVSQFKKVTVEKFYDLCNEQTDKQILEQYLQSKNEECEKLNLDQIVDKRYGNRDIEIQVGNNTVNQCQIQNNVDSKANQIEDTSINQYFEQSKMLPTEPDRLDIDNSNDKVLNDVDIFELNKKQSNKHSKEQTYHSSVGKHINMEELIPKSKRRSQGTVESNVQEINRQLFKDCNDKRIEEVSNIFNEAHAAGTESIRGLNIGQLKRAIFEECYDPECGNGCKNQGHHSYTKSHKKDDKQYKKQTNYIPRQPDIDLLYKQQCHQTTTDNLKKQLKKTSFDPNSKEIRNKSFIERHKLSHSDKYKTRYKKIAIDHIPGQYIELRWKESEGKSNTLGHDGCKRKHTELDLDQRKMLCSETINNFSQQIMAECPECGYTTDDNDFMNYKSDVDLRITKPLSLINKDMLISLHDKETKDNNKNNENNNRVTLESVYAMELAYVTAIQALERKLKQKIAISEYRLRRVNNLSKINNQLTKANVALMDLSHRNKV